MLKWICADDPEALDLLNRVLKGRQGGRTDLGYNAHEIEERLRGTLEIGLTTLSKFDTL